jgi:hypothetical protein
MFRLVPASMHSTNLYDIYLMLCVQSWTPSGGGKDRPKHVERYSINSKIVHLVGFTIEVNGNISGETPPLCYIESQNITKHKSFNVVITKVYFYIASLNDMFRPFHGPSSGWSLFSLQGKPYN